MIGRRAFLRNVGQAALMLTLGSKTVLASTALAKPSGISSHLSKPYGLMKYHGFFARDILFVTDIDKCAVVIFDTNGKYIGELGQKGSDSSNQFLYPTGITADLSDNLYVTDFQNCSVHSIDDGLKISGDWGKSGHGDGEMYYPRDITFTGCEIWPWPFWPRLYVVDSGNHRVQSFYTDGTFIQSFGSYGTNSGEFNTPMGIVLWAGIDYSVLYVTDGGNHRVQAFTPDGDYRYSWGRKGAKNGEFDTPAGIDYSDDLKRIYVADSGNHRVQVFNEQGKFISTWGNQGTGEGEFDTPIGICVSDYLKKVFVADSGNGRVQAFDLDGKFIGIIC